MSDRNRDKPSVGRIIFLVLSPVWLLLLLAAALFAVLSLSTFPVDDQAALIALEPMPVSERYAFDAGNKTVSIAVDASDVAFAAEQSGEFDIEALAKPLSDYGLTLSGYGLRFAPEGAYLNAKLTAFGFVPIPLKIRCSVSAGEEGAIHAAVTDARLTKFYVLTASELAEKFGVSKEDLTFTIEGESIHPRLKTLTDVATQDDRLILTCAFGDILSDIMADPSFADAAANVVSGSPVLDAYNSISVSSALRELDPFAMSAAVPEKTYTYGPAYDELYTMLEKDPSLLQGVRLDVLALSDPAKASEAFTGDLPAYAARFLPEVTDANVAAKHAEYRARIEESAELTVQMLEKLLTAYTEGNLLYAGESFVMKGAEDTPVTVKELVDDFSPYESFLDPDKTRIILCCGDNGNMGFGYDTPFRSQPRVKGAKLSAKLKMAEKYLPVIMTKLVSGKCAFVYLIDRGGTPELCIDTFKEPVYSAFMAEELIPAAFFGPAGDNT